MSPATYLLTGRGHEAQQALGGRVVLAREDFDIHRLSNHQVNGKRASTWPAATACGVQRAACPLPKPAAMSLNTCETPFMHGCTDVTHHLQHGALMLGPVKSAGGGLNRLLLAAVAAAVGRKLQGAQSLIRERVVGTKSHPFVLSYSVHSILRRSSKHLG